MTREVLQQALEALEDLIEAEEKIRGNK